MLESLNPLKLIHDQTCHLCVYGKLNLIGIVLLQDRVKRISPFNTMDNVYEAHIHDKIHTSFYWVTIYIEDTFVWDGLQPIGAVIILQ